MTEFNDIKWSEQPDPSNETKEKNEAHLNKNRINPSVQKTNVHKISDHIGKGEEAKNSIVWIIIRWSLIIPSGITALYFITMWIIYALYANPEVQVSQVRENILKIWAIFSPLITLALGYIYGKSGTEPEEKS